MSAYLFRPRTAAVDPQAVAPTYDVLVIPLAYGGQDVADLMHDGW